MSARKDKIINEIIVGMPVHYISAGCEAALITRVRSQHTIDLVAFSPGRQRERFFEYCGYSSDLGPGYVPGSWHQLEDHEPAEKTTNQLIFRELKTAAVSSVQMAWERSRPLSKLTDEIRKIIQDTADLAARQQDATRPDEMVILAARHLDPAEGRMRDGHTLDQTDISALRQVLGYVGAMHAERTRSS